MANRCGREGMFLKSSEREILLERVATFEKRRSQSNTETSPSKDSLDERWFDGCRVCKKDNNHSDMLLCERCNAEYHFYCVGLDKVPSEDWFCGEYP
jgi:PHD-finger